MYRWITDSGCHPFLQAKTDILGVIVPEGFDHDGIITLDISEDSVRNLRMDEHVVTFEAVFNDQIHKIRFPMPAIIGIHAEENGMGMEFHDEDDAGSGSVSNEAGEPNLRVL